MPGLGSALRTRHTLEGSEIDALLACGALVDIVEAYGVDNTGNNDIGGSGPSSVNAALASLGTGQTAYLPAGTYKAATPIPMPNSSFAIKGAPGAVIKGAMTTAGDSFSHSCFISTPVTAVLTTLSANAVMGATTISVAASIPVGTRIFLQGSNIGQQFLTTAVSGAGPYTVPLDVPVAWPYWLSGATVYSLTTIHDVVIDGLTFTGTGDRAIEVSAGDNVLVRNCKVTTSGGSFLGGYAMSFDIGSRFCRYENLDVDSGGVALGPAFESNYGSSFGRVSSRNSVQSGNGAGLFILGSAHVHGDELLATGNDQGLRISLVDTTNDKIGSHDVQIGKVVASSNSHGVSIGTGLGISIGAIIAKNNGAAGVGYALWVNPATVGGNPVPTEVNIGTLDTAYTSGWSVDVEAGADVHVGKHVSLNDGHWVAGDGANEGGLRIMGGRYVVDAVDLTFMGADVTGHAGYEWISHLYGEVIVNSIRCTWKAGGDAYVLGAIYGSGGSIYLANVKYDTASSNGWYSTGLATTPVSFGPNINLSLVSLTANWIHVPAGYLSMTQGAGTYASTTTTGTDATIVGLGYNTITSAAILSGNTVVNVPAGIPGLTYTVFNNATLNGHTWSVGVDGGTAIAIAAGKRAVLMSDGTNMQRVSADT